MKAQMSLEMVIGLLILLVVAAVVISLFLNTTKNIGVQSYQQSLAYTNFVANCKSICSDAQSAGTEAALAKYCYTKLMGNTDLQNDGKVDAIPATTKLLDVCEDGLYCFQVATCSNVEGVQIDWSDCRQILCSAYYQVYQDYNLANAKVQQLFPNGIGSCTLPQNEANWYNLYFGANPCTQGPSGTSATTSTTTSATSSPTVVSVSCAKQSSTSVLCNWTCPNAISSQSPGYLSISGTLQSVTITTQTGSFTFPNLTPGTKYNVGVVCDINNAQLSQGVSIQI